MDFSKIKRGLFALKKEVNENKEEQSVPEQTLKEKLTYQDYGFHQAGRLGGSLPGLRICLQKIYMDFRQETRDDITKQDELKKPYKVKIEDHKGEIDKLEKRLDRIKTEHIPEARSRIQSLKDELSHIRKNPQEVTGDDAGRASFVIGGIILLFLTIYLFIFYSSASYSAFFKEFSINEIGVVNSIFDAQALSKATKDGVTELALILTIPFVFLGLGYLIHKFQEQKSGVKFVKIGLLIAITFIFDSILAYEITEKIYNIKKEGSFVTMPDYTLSMAFSSINFWLVIFAGFVVYIIWGFVFDFVIEAYGKMDKVKIALKEKDKQIHDAISELKDLETQVEKLNHAIDEHAKEINKLNKILESSIIPREFEQDIFSFSAGWMAWMKHSGKSHSELEEADKTTHEFIKVTIYNIDTINTN